MGKSWHLFPRFKINHKVKWKPTKKTDLKFTSMKLATNSAVMQWKFIFRFWKKKNPILLLKMNYLLLLTTKNLNLLLKITSVELV